MANLPPIQLTPAVQTSNGDAPNAGLEDGNSGFSEELQGAISLQNQKSEDTVAAALAPDHPDSLPRPEDLALQILPLVNWVPGVLPANFASPTTQASPSAIQGVASGSDAAASAAQTAPQAMPNVGGAVVVQDAPTAADLATVADQSVQPSLSTRSEEPTSAVRATPLEGTFLAASAASAQERALSTPLARGGTNDLSIASKQSTASVVASDDARALTPPSMQGLTEKLEAGTTQALGALHSLPVIDRTGIVVSKPVAPVEDDGAAKVLASGSEILHMPEMHVAATAQGAIAATVTVTVARSSVAMPEVRDAELTATRMTQAVGEVPTVSETDNVQAADALPAMLPSGDMEQLTVQASSEVVTAAKEQAMPMSSTPSPAVAMSHSVQDALTDGASTKSGWSVLPTDTPTVAKSQEISIASAGVSSELSALKIKDAKQERTTALSALDPLSVDEVSGVKATMSSAMVHHAEQLAKGDPQTAATPPYQAIVGTTPTPSRPTLSAMVSTTARDDEEATAPTTQTPPVLRDVDSVTPSAPLTTFLSTLIGQPVVSHVSKETTWLPTVTAPHPLEPHEVKLDSGQVQVEILRMVKHGGGQVVMELTPPDQSKFRIDLQIDAQGQATLVVEGASDSTRTRLEQGASGLQQQFAEMGLQLQLDMRQSRDFGARQNSAQLAEEGGASGVPTPAGRAENLSAQKPLRREAFEGNVHLYA